MDNVDGSPDSGFFFHAVGIVPTADSKEEFLK